MNERLIVAIIILALGILLLRYSNDFYYYAIYKQKKKLDYHVKFDLRNELNKQRYWSTKLFAIGLIAVSIIFIIKEMIDMTDFF